MRLLGLIQQLRAKHQQTPLQGGGNAQPNMPIYLQGTQGGGGNIQQASGNMNMPTPPPANYQFPMVMQNGLPSRFTPTGPPSYNLNSGMWGARGQVMPQPLQMHKKLPLMPIARM